MLPHCEFALPSLDDMNAIYPGQTPQQIARHILSLGPHVVVLKMGAEGCLVTDRCSGSSVHVRAIATKVVDTTGAGDCFNAGFLAGLAEGLDLVACARMGAACASFCIEAVGGTTGIPNLQTVQSRVTASATDGN